MRAEKALGRVQESGEVEVHGGLCSLPTFVASHSLSKPSCARMHGKAERASGVLHADWRVVRGFLSLFSPDKDPGAPADNAAAKMDAPL